MRKRLGVLLGLLGLLHLPGCAEPVTGALSFEGADGRSVVFAPDQCFDGNPRGFLGAYFEDDDHRVVEFFDVDGAPGVIVHAPGDFAFDLGPEDCQTFAGTLTRDFNRVTDAGKVRGRLELDCAPLGWVVEGELSFEECIAEDEDDGHDH